MSCQRHGGQVPVEELIPDEAARAFLISDDVWARFEPLIPARANTHKFGGGRPRACDRCCLDGILYLLRTGCHWKALSATGICKSSTAHDRLTAWVAAGTFLALWRAALAAYDDLVGLDWRWLAMDGCMTKAPLAGGKNRPEPGRPGQARHEAEPDDRGRRRPRGGRRGRGERARPEAGPRDGREPAGRRGRPPVVRGKPQGLCLDKDYDYAEVYDLCAEFAFTAHVVARGTEAQQLKRSARKRARRWAVERTHSWMNRFRGILVRWSKRADNYLALLHFVCALITLRCAGLSG
jgi:putative transposase